MAARCRGGPGVSGKTGQPLAANARVKNEGQMHKTVLLVITTVIIQGCATAYQPSSFNGGYAESRLAPNVFAVTFNGNRFTDMAKVEAFTLLRCAELALANGYNYFEIVEAYQYVGQAGKAYPEGIYSTGSAYRNENIRTIITTGGNLLPSAARRLGNKIICFKDKPPIFSYHALVTRDSIIKKYRIR